VIDLSKPLARGRMLHIQDSSTWVAFKYEKLPKMVAWVVLDSEIAQRQEMRGACNSIDCGFTFSFPLEGA
jgi:hypothetical protein